MDLSRYKCSRDPHDWRKVLRERMGCSDAKGFIHVKTENNFDLKKYKGEFPAGIIMNKNTVLGWTNNTNATNTAELEPWLTNPPFRYLWGTAIPVYETSYKDTVMQLNHRCVQLASPPEYLNADEIYFETSRHILWHLVLATKCIPIETLVNLEVAYMKSLIKYSPDILHKCQKLYQLEYPTEGCLEAWIRDQYAKGKLPDNHEVEDWMLRIKNSVKEMLT